MKLFTILAVAAASVLAAPTGASAALIANGSFETPTVPAGNFTNFTVGSAMLTGWTVFGPAGTNVSIVSTTFSQSGITFEAQDGVQWLDLTGDGSNSTEGVSQVVATTTGHQYQLSYFVGNTSGGGGFGTTSTVDVSVNGVPAFADTNSNVSPTNLNWEQFTHAFVAIGTSTTLAFQNADPANDNSNGLDDIVLTDLGPASVPAPLIGFGLPVFLAVGGLWLGSKLLERSRTGAGMIGIARGGVGS